MEESEKRKERLKAMRTEAAQAGLHSETGNSMGVSRSLTNPLIESSANPSMPVDTRASPRFDFYTDPMAAFSANKRRSKVSHQNTPDYFTSSRPRNPDLTPSSVHQAQTNSSQDARMFQAQGSCHSSGPFGSPMQTPNRFQTPQGNTNFCSGPSGSPTYHFPSNLPRAGNTPSPGFGQGGSPSFRYGQGRAYGFNNSPQAGSGYRGSPYSDIGRGCSPQAGSGYRGGPYSNIARGCSPQAGSGFRGSPYSNIGRGNSPQAGFGNKGTPYPSPGRGRSGGRGRGSHNYVSAEERPDRYYSKSMIEDPWKTLKPVIWQRKYVPTSSVAPDSEKSWLPKSVTSKKARVSEALDKYRSKQSLAEYLAASFNEAVHESEDEDAQESI